jgi:translation initiation factor 3 subunit G
VDETGVKTRVRHVPVSSNPDGGHATVKRVTTKIRVIKRSKRIPSAVIRRREGLKGFGECANKTMGTLESGITTIERDESSVTPVLGGAAADDGKRGGTSGNATTAEAFTLQLVCRKCGKAGDHWTSKCPYRDLSADALAEVLAANEAETGVAVPAALAAGANTSTTSTASSSGAAGKYQPPSMRNRAPGSSLPPSGPQRDDSTTVRVTNLSEDVHEADLQDLFAPIGRILRLFLAKDRQGASRGFAFITYQYREDAKKAIAKLNGHGFDHLILRVEWAAPRDEKPKGYRPRV